MPAPTNTVTQLTSIGRREDLSDVISRVQPEKTPFFSTVKKGKATNLRTEWQVEQLAAPAVNAMLEGDDVGTLGAANVTARVSNICQIFAKTGGVARSTEVAQHAGRSSELARQKAVKMVELKRDIELSMLSISASRLEAGANPRLSAGIRSWITTSSSLGATGVNGGFNAGTSIVDAPNPGTARTFTEALLKGVAQTRFTAAGDATKLICYMSPNSKQIASTFTGISAQRKESGDTAATTRIIGGADVYASDFGDIVFVPHAYAFSAANAAVLVDPDYVEWAWFDGVKNTELAKTGDSEKFLMTGEGTLKVTNERAHAVIHALS
jgi:hypothetical protein